MFTTIYDFVFSSLQITIRIIDAIKFVYCNSGQNSCIRIFICAITKFLKRIRFYGYITFYNQ